MKRQRYDKTAFAARETFPAFVEQYEDDTTIAEKRQGEMGARVSAFLKLLRTDKTGQ